MRRSAIVLLRRAPGFTLTASLTLALGAGLTTTMFGVLDALLFPPGRAALARLYRLERVGMVATEADVSFREFREIRERWRRTRRVAALHTQLAVLTVGDIDVDVTCAVASANALSLTRSRAAAGRLFTEADEASGQPVAIVTTRMAARLFANGPAAVGRVIRVDGSPYSIVGTVNSASTMAPGVDVWLVAGGARMQRPGESGWALVVEIDDARHVRAVERELQSLLDGRVVGKARGGEVVRLARVGDSAEATDAPVLWLLLAASGLVLLVGCLNVGGLLLVRTISRRHELAIHSALGASRAHIMAHLLAEAAVISGLGVTAGLGIGAAGTRAFVALFPLTASQTLPDVGINGHVLVLVAAMAVVSAVAAGIVPALAASRLNLGQMLNRGMAGGAPRARRVRAIVITAQMGIAFTLATVASMLLVHLWRMHRIDFGYRIEGLILAEARGATPRARTVGRLTVDRISAAIGERSGISNVAVVTSLPVPQGRVAVEVGGRAAERFLGVSGVRAVSANYLRVLGAPMLRGRDFAEHDRHGPGAVIVNQAMARRLFGDASPLGRRIRLPVRDSMTAWLPVIGVVGGLFHVPPVGSARRMDPPPAAYVLEQEPPHGSFDIIVRSRAAPFEVEHLLRSALREVEPDFRIGSVTTMSEFLDEFIKPLRFMGAVVAAFAVSAVLLALLGFYALVAHAAALRSREVAIRLAVGATVPSVGALLVREALGIAALGLAIGAVVTWACAGILRAMLPGLAAIDVSVLLVPALLLLSGAMVASYGGIRGTLHADPMATLRSI